MDTYEHPSFSNTQTSIFFYFFAISHEDDDYLSYGFNLVSFYHKKYNKNIRNKNFI